MWINYLLRLKAKLKFIERLKIITEIKPTILFYRSEDGKKYNLIEQIATDKVKELIKTSGNNTVDVEIHSVTLL